ncbi:MAG: methylated-DNA--[protein]-cysteine S-methyltransferase [Pseudomonadota bacterium]
MFEHTIHTPFGALTLTEEGGALTKLVWRDTSRMDGTPLLREAEAQLQAYCDSRLDSFDLPTRVIGSPLQQAVCAEMQAIPLGETRTYGAIAKAVGASAQAVGQACGGNPLPVIIPCHRVMGAGGKLTGFSGRGGVETKVALLRHEGALTEKGAFLL